VFRAHAEIRRYQAGQKVPVAALIFLCNFSCGRGYLSDKRRQEQTGQWRPVSQSVSCHREIESPLYTNTRNILYTPEALEKMNSTQNYVDTYYSFLL
jgi:hypothetical protein